MKRRLHTVEETEEEGKTKYRLTVKGQVRYHLYEKKARKQNFCWDLTEASFCYLQRQPCAFCHGKANVINRIDPTQCYRLDNILACCSSCARAKGPLAPDEFIDICQTVSDAAKHSPWTQAQEKLLLQNKEGFPEYPVV